jgi:hypothetical protein
MRSCYLALLTFLFAFTFGSSMAQSSISLGRDTISATAAQNAQSKFKNDLNACGKKSTSMVTFDVGQLNDIIQQCRLNSIYKVQFVIATLQVKDTAHYLRHHPGLTTSEKADLIGKQTLLIKVPRAAFSGFSQSGSYIPKESQLMLSLLAAGLVNVDRPYGKLLLADDMYFEIGTICPPPSICN